MLMMRARWGTLAVRLEEKERKNKAKTAWQKVGQQTRHQGEVRRRWGETHMLLGVVRRLQWANSVDEDQRCGDGECQG